MQNTIELGNRKAGRPAPFFRHTKRNDWGLAVLMWEREGKRGYCFEDGQTRVIADGYYHLLQAIPRADAPEETLQKLSKVAVTKADGTKPSRAKAELPSFDEQLAYFLELYPDGFRGETWRKKHRGVLAKRRLKRHRDAALEEAADRLGAEALDGLLAQGNHRAVRDRVVEVLEKTDLVAKGHLDTLRGAQPTEELARALREFVHGDAGEGVRFDRLRCALGRAGANGSSWPLMTALRALTHPGEHVCVRPSVLKPQAKVIGHKRKLKTQPTPKSYGRCLAVAQAVRDALTDHGHAPRDFLDVYDFVWVTMRPAARKELLQRRQQVSPPEAAEAA